MKKGIHPDYHEITYVMTDGKEVKTRSTLGKAGDKITLEIDPKSHPVWTGVYRMVDTGGQLAKFKSKFGAFSGGSSADKKEEKPAAKKAEKK